MTTRNYSSVASAKTLAADVTDTATTMTLNNLTGLPSYPYVLVINPDTAQEEAVLVTSNVTGNQVNITRAIETDATAYAHTSGDTVRHMIVGTDLQESQDHIGSTTAHDATGGVVGATKTQTLTNKTIALGSNTVSGTLAQFNAALTSADFASLDGAETLTNKTLTSPRANTPKFNEDVAMTATSTELNVLDGITASTAELNILDGVTATASELNVLDGITATVTELNYVDGVTSAIQTQLDSLDTSRDAIDAAWSVWDSSAPNGEPTLSGGWINSGANPGTWIAYYKKIGKTCFVQAQYTLGSTTTKGTTLQVSLPVKAARIGATMGPAYFSRGSAIGACTNDSSVDYVRLYVYNSAATYLNFDGITATVPGTWATNDYFRFNFVYECE